MGQLDERVDDGVAGRISRFGRSPPLSEGAELLGINRSLVDEIVGDPDEGVEGENVTSDFSGRIRLE